MSSGKYLVALAVLFGCGSLTDPPSTGRQLYVSATGLVMDVGDTAYVGVALQNDGVFSFTPPFGQQPLITATVTWQVANQQVASVDADGLITALGVGRTSISVAVAGKTDSLTLFVRSAPSPPVHFTFIGVGGSHACGLLAGGAVACWGGSWLGELGEGRQRRMTATVSPRVIAGVTAVQLSVGTMHTCALDAAGTVRCWGDNLFSQTRPGGHGTALTIGPIGLPGPAIMVAAGGDHSCAVTVDGVTRCWGRTYNGIESIATPAPLVQLSSGNSHTCGLTSAGAAFCFGSNDFGELGAGDQAVHTGAVAVATPTPLLSISAGTGFTCGIDASHHALCWGFGSFGQLGNGTNDAVRPIPAPVLLATTVSAIDAGTAHACAIAVSGVAYCWGTNFSGELGISQIPKPEHTADSLIFLTPQRVDSPDTFRQVAAGSSGITCALAVDDVASCWGNNGAGTLGIGRHNWYPGLQFSMRIAPTRVVAPDLP